MSTLKDRTLDAAVALAETYLRDLRLEGSEAGAPVNGHGPGIAELRDRNRVSGLSQAPGTPLFVDPVFVAFLDDLREREVDLASGLNVFLEPARIVQLIAIDDDGHLTSRIAADIAKNEGGRVAIPLDAPFDVPALNLTSGLSLLDRVRILGELVRILGDAVRRLGLDQSRLGDLAGLLRSAIREYNACDGDKQSQHGDQQRPVHTTRSHTREVD